MGKPRQKSFSLKKAHLPDIRNSHQICGTSAEPSAKTFGSKDGRKQNVLSQDKPRRFEIDPTDVGQARARK